MHTTLRLAALCLTLVGTASAQRFLVVETPSRVHRVDVGAGPLFDYDYLDLTPDPVGLLWDAAPVGAEIWVSGNDGIARFDAASLTRTGTITGAKGYAGIQPVAGGAWVVRMPGFFEKYDLTGNLVSSTQVPFPLDVFLLNGELLVSNDVNSSIDRYDLNGQPLGALTQPGLGAGIDFNGFGYLALRPSNGNLLLVANLRIYEIDPVSGTLLGEYQAGMFEQSALGLEDGRVLSLNAADASVFDPDAPVDFGATVPTTESRSFRYASRLDAGVPDARRFCTAGVNSTGVGALVSVLGTKRVADGSLWLDAVHGPSATFGLFVYGAPGVSSPFGNGELCLDPSGPGVVRTDTVGLFDANGSRLLVELPYADFPPSAPIVPGSTWAFQYVYRDAAAGGAEFNATDAIALTFE